MAPALPKVRGNNGHDGVISLCFPKKLQRSAVTSHASNFEHVSCMNTMKASIKPHK